MEIDELTIGRRQPTGPARRRLAMLVVSLAAIALLVVARSLVSSTSGTERGLLAPDRVNLKILLLGDSSAGKDTCVGPCVTYTEQLAASLAQDAERRVRIDDRSWRSNAWPPSSVGSVLIYLRTDPGLREVVRTADVLVLALTNGNAPSRQFEEQLDAVLSEVSLVRQDRPIVLQVIVAPWPRTSGNPGRQELAAGCQVARSHHGTCVNLYDLMQGGLLTRGDWVLVTGHPGLSQRGHDAVARELIAADGPGVSSSRDVAE